MTAFEYCIPIYNGEDNWRAIEAYDEEEAARAVAQMYNEGGDYSLMHDNTEFVLIREDEDSPIKIFVMSAEPSIDYYAYEETKFKCRFCKKNIKQKVISGEVHVQENHIYCDYECWKKWQAEYIAKYRKDMEDYEKKRNEKTS